MRKQQELEREEKRKEEEKEEKRKPNILKNTSFASIQYI